MEDVDGTIMSIDEIVKNINGTLRSVSITFKNTSAKLLGTLTL
jgi:hypothetical protein